jgi:hypothetical protein
VVGVSSSVYAFCKKAFVATPCQKGTVGEERKRPSRLDSLQATAAT